MINVIYGVLSLGKAKPDMVGFRYSDVTANGKQRTILSGLIPDKSENCLIYVDYILKLLSCSPLWPTLIRDLDPNNTYDVDVVNGSNTECSLSYSPMQRLLDWERDVNITDERFPYSSLDPAIDRVVAKLAAVLMLSEK